MAAPRKGWAQLGSQRAEGGVAGAVILLGFALLAGVIGLVAFVSDDDSDDSGNPLNRRTETYPATPTFQYPTETNPYDPTDPPYTTVPTTYYDPTMIPLHFEWEFGGQEWTWEFSLDRDTYQYYHDRDRTGYTYQYAAFVTDPNDDDLMTDLAERIADAADDEGYSEFERLNFALAFVQSLPYAYDDVTTSFNEYPRYPVETLVDDGSDCEDTSILFASLVLAMGYDAVMLSPEGHMAAGVWASDLPGTYYTHEGRKYFYAETTGEGYEIGEVPREWKGETAKIYSLEARAEFTERHWTYEYRDGSAEVYVEATNTGSITAEDAVFYAAWDAGGGQVWDQVSCDPIDAQPGSKVWCNITMDAPPDGVQTRLIAKVWADNVSTKAAYSEWFYV